MATIWSLWLPRNEVIFKGTTVTDDVVLDPGPGFMPRLLIHIISFLNDIESDVVPSSLIVIGFQLGNNLLGYGPWVRGFVLKGYLRHV
ncbi:hypothetical protein HKD37_15G042791 [Glycine soja]|uniref:Uncharacterized protein n=1 Tax=Glycine soja TaxID=3848 RepID=A0A445GU95_GLYSO|nr:hypothetical protein D0Y65_041070 [Glycine soja]